MGIFFCCEHGPKIDYYTEFSDSEEEGKQGYYYLCIPPESTERAINNPRINAEEDYYPYYSPVIPASI